MKGVRLLVGCVGDQFMPGVKEAISEAVEIIRAGGATVDVKVQPPITVLPFFGLATMRNRLTMMAVEEQYSHLLLLDNDVRLCGVLGPLLRSNADITVPTLCQEYALDGHGRVKLKEGERQIKWAVFSCLMFRVSAFRKIGVAPFDESLCYCQEETTFQRWRLAGARAYCTDQVVVDLLRPPTNLWELKPEEMFRLKTPGNVPKASIR